MRKKQHLITVVYSTYDDDADVFAFKNETDLCNFYHDIYEDIDLGDVFIFDVDFYNKPHIYCADKTMSKCAIPDAVLLAVTKAFLINKKPD